MYFSHSLCWKSPRVHLERFDCWQMLSWLVNSRNLFWSTRKFLSQFNLTKIPLLESIELFFSHFVLCIYVICFTFSKFVCTYIWLSLYNKLMVLILLSYILGIGKFLSHFNLMKIPLLESHWTFIFFFCSLRICWIMGLGCICPLHVSVLAGRTLQAY